MPVHIGPQLISLAALCETIIEGIFNGWSVDSWTLDENALAALEAVYQALLLGDLEADIAESLAEDGVDVEALLVDAEGGRDVITRSDLTELLAAAAALKVEQWPEETLQLPNVPKGSRRRSEVGIDILAAHMDFQSARDTLQADERLYIGSVKHTLTNPRNLRHKLVKSISPTDLTSPYVAQQLRVLNGRLAADGINRKRLYLFLANFPDADHVEMTLIGALDTESAEAFMEEMSALPAADGWRHCRHLLIDDIASLHQLGNDA